MEDNISLELPRQDKSALPGVAIALVLFICLSGLINYAYFKDIFLISEGRGEDFDFSAFLTYNLGIKFLLYPFKFIGLVALLMLGAFLFKVEDLKVLDLFRIVIIAELIKYLPEITKILWFTFVSSDNLEGYELGLIDDYLSINSLLGITSENVIHPLFSYISITQGLYILVIGQLINSHVPKGLGYHLQWVFITYGVCVLLIGTFAVITHL